MITGQQALDAIARDQKIMADLSINLAAATSRNDHLEAGLRRYRTLYRKECDASDNLRVELKAKIEDLERVLYAVIHGHDISTKHNSVVHHDHQTGRCKVYRQETLADKVAAAKPGDTVIHCCDDVFRVKEIVFTKDEIMDALKKLWMKP